jgi:hypothetical protein
VTPKKHYLSANRIVCANWLAVWAVEVYKKENKVRYSKNSFFQVVFRLYVGPPSANQILAHRVISPTLSIMRNSYRSVEGFRLGRYLKIACFHRKVWSSLNRAVLGGVPPLCFNALMFLLCGILIFTSVSPYSIYYGLFGEKIVKMGYSAQKLFPIYLGALGDLRLSMRQERKYNGFPNVFGVQQLDANSLNAMLINRKSEIQPSSVKISDFRFMSHSIQTNSIELLDPESMCAHFGILEISFLSQL